VPPEGTRATTHLVTVWYHEQTNSRTNNKFVSLNQNICCCSHHQAQGAYARINQKVSKDIYEAIIDNTVIRYDNNPVPYIFFLELLPEPPDGLTRSFFFHFLMLFVYVYPMFTVIVK
jgi:hypothetical protein